MKTKLLFTALLTLGVATAFISCNGNADKPDNPVNPKDTVTAPRDTAKIDTTGDKKPVLLDPNVGLSVGGVNSLTHSRYNSKGIAGTDMTDSISFIVKYAWSMKYKSPYTYYESHVSGYPEYRDDANNKIKMYGTDVIKSETELGYFITKESFDIIFVMGFDKDSLPISMVDFMIASDAGNPIPWPIYYDTVAYIPNKVYRRAEMDIRNAFAAKDIKRCYELFDSAFVFVPTTGARWLALKAAGIE